LAGSIGSNEFDPTLNIDAPKTRLQLFQYRASKNNAEIWIFSGSR
jgi:hypothetical protein